MREAAHVPLVGMDTVARQLRDVLVEPLRNAEAFEWLQVPLPRGVLVHGPPGVGKTSVVRRVCHEVGMRVFDVNCGTVVKVCGCRCA